MKIWLSAAVAACIFVLATAGIASASNSDGHSYGHGHGHGHHHDGHGHGKPHLPPIDTSNAANCDFIAEPGNALCMLPFPDDYYTRPDASSPTGRRVDLTTDGMPANAFGDHIDAAPYNASDGFSPGRDDPAQGARASTPRPTCARPARCRSTTCASTRRPNAPVVVIDATTGKRWPIWVEIDSNAAEPEQGGARDPPGGQLRLRPPLHRRPAQPSKRRRRGNRGARRRSATTATTSPPSRKRSTPAARTSRDIFTTLHKAGIDRKDLYLAWDFTVASDENNAGRELAMRNDAFAQLGDTNLADAGPQGQLADLRQSRESKTNRTRARSRGASKATFTVPCYLFPSCGPGGTMQLDSNGDPIAERRLDGQLRLHHPASVDERARRNRPALALRPRAVRHRRARSAPSPQRELAQAHEIVFCATDEIGMSESDAAGRDRRPAERCRASRRCPTASSRACSTRCTSAGR